MPATCVACSDWFESKGAFAFAYFGDGGAKARATITFRDVKDRFPLGKPAGIAKPFWDRNGCVWLTPSSMIPIFIPLPAVVRFGPQSVGRADQVRRLVQSGSRRAERVVADRRVDARDAREAREAADLRGRQIDGERVQDDAVAPAHVRLRQDAVDAALKRALRRREAAEVAHARRRAQVEPPGARRLRQNAAVGRRIRERRCVERDHDLGPRRARGSRPGDREGRRQAAES